MIKKKMDDDISEVNSTYEQVSHMIKNEDYNSFGQVLELQHLASDGNIIFTIIDKNEKRYNAEVQYDFITGKISPPINQLIDINYLQSVPVEILHEIIINMNLDDITKLCQSNSVLNIAICQNQDFWRKKYLHDYHVKPEQIKIVVDDWKKIYQDIAIKRHTNEYVLPLEKFIDKYPDIDFFVEYTHNDQEYIPDNVNRIIMDYFKRKNITLKKGDLLYPNSFDIDRNSGLLIFDGEKVIDLASDGDDYGNLPNTIRILEEPEYFPPRYWYNLFRDVNYQPQNENEDVDSSWRGIDHNFIIQFNHVPYRKELILNIKYEKISEYSGEEGEGEGGEGEYYMYTTFVDQRGIKRKIIFDHANIECQENEECIRKVFENYFQYYDELFFESFSYDIDIKLNDIDFIYSGTYISLNT